MKINKILGKRGRITIPYELRIKMGFRYNDVVSFEEQDNNTIIIRSEKIGDGCRDTDIKTMEKPTNMTTLMDFIDELPIKEQRAAFVHLMMKWTDLQDGVKK